MTVGSPEEIKACCAVAYSSDLVALLLGDSYHPGGLALTRRLARQLALPADALVLDVASGRGASAIPLAQEFGLRVVGVDLSSVNVVLAQGRTDAEGLAGRVSFTVGDAEHLPHADATFAGVVVECALCTFPDKRAAATEVARVLRPGGKLGLTEVVADTRRFPPELNTFATRLACLAEALPLAGYVSLIEAAGLSTLHAERHETAIIRMIGQIAARLEVIGLTAPATIEELGLDISRVGRVLAAAQAATQDRALGYGLLVAEKPA